MTDRPDPVIAVCFPMYGRPATQFLWSLQQLSRPNSASELWGRRGASYLVPVTSHTIVVARNTLTELALDADAVGKATHVLMVDDDMEFPPDALKRLWDHDLPIVGGLCHNRRVPYSPIVMRRQRDRDSLGFVYDYPRGKVVECDATGAGFLLIKREVFEAISERCGDTNGPEGSGGWWNQRRAMSEDFSFCERAKEAGFPIHVDCGLEIGHVAEVVIYAGIAEKLRPFQLNRWSALPDADREPGAAPVASIVIPTYNQDPRHLKAAVLSASKQTVPVEVIVIDDGSDPPVPYEGWPENVRVYQHVEKDPASYDGAGPYLLFPCKGPHRAVMEPLNRGIAAALNSGISMMHTDWFCWLSSDDMLDPRKVEMQLSSLRAAGPSAKLSFHRYEVFTDGSEQLALFSQVPSWATIEDQMDHLARACAINGLTVMIHRSVFDEVGTFNPEYLYGQDWEFWCRAGVRHLWYGVGEILGARREKPGNLTQSIAASPEGDARKARRNIEDAAIVNRYAHWKR